MDYLLRPHHATKGRFRTLERYAPALLEERGRRVVCRSDTKHLSIAEIHVSERRLANAHRICENGLEDRLQFPGRSRDDLQHLGGCRLLLQWLREFLFQVRVGCAKPVNVSSRLRCLRKNTGNASSALCPFAKQGHLVGTVNGLARVPSLDHLVRDSEHLWRNAEAECLSSLEIDH
jgi:hypothetical protein